MPLLTATQQAAALRSGEVTSAELLEQTFAAIDAHEPTVNAFISQTDRDALRAEAEQIDAERAQGNALPDFAGVPIAVKDNIALEGHRLTCASRMLERYTTPFDATVVAKLKQHRPLIIGKTNLDEFGFGSSTENSAFHTTANPWKPTHVPGGSSGGSAAAVAARFTPWALGSDTGGSIRQPASFCGVFGLRPTYGRVSRYGLVAFASSMDTIGPFAHSCEDLLALLRIIQGDDPLDATSSRPPAATPLPKQPRLGVLPELFGPPCTHEVSSARSIVEAAATDAGWSTDHFTIDYTDEALSAYYIISSVEAASNLARYDGIRYGYRAENANSWNDLVVRSRSEAFGEEVKRRILLGTFTASAGYADKYYDTACRARRRIYNEYMRIMDRCDVLLAPISPTPAWALGAKTDDPLEMYLSDVLSVSVALAGLPAVAMPTGVNEQGLPVGVQLIGKPHADESLLELAGVLERSIRFDAAPASLTA